MIPVMLIADDPAPVNRRVVLLGGNGIAPPKRVS